MTSIAEEIDAALSTIQLSIEEILSCLGEEPSEGDGGFAEAVVDLENGIVTAYAKRRKRK